MAAISAAVASARLGYGVISIRRTSRHQPEFRSCAASRRTANSEIPTCNKRPVNPLQACQGPAAAASLTMLWRGRSADNRSRLPAAIHALARTHVARRPIARGLPPGDEATLVGPESR
jgi:hypothetical protein